MQSANPHLMSEVQDLLSDSGFRASERQKRLLLYLAEHHDDPVEQQDIARDILGKGADFDPGIDAHVRIEISRLRSALAVYYTSQGATRSTRLTIPKGKYQLELCSPAPYLAPKQQASSPPVLVSLSFCPSADLLKSDLGAAMQAGFFADLFCYPLVQDRGLQFAPASATDLCSAVDHAKASGAQFAALVFVYGQAPDYTARLSLLDADKGIVIGSFQSHLTQSATQNMEWHWNGLIDYLADPLLGRLPDLASRAYPKSRLALLLTAYRFMATQTPALAQAALPVLQYENEIAPTGTSIALEADMLRVLQSLACDGRDGTGQANPCYDAALTRAETALQTDPEAIAAQLALGYAELAMGNWQKAGYLAAALQRRHMMGSPKQDRDLLALLASETSLPAAEEDKDRSLMADAAALVHCLDIVDIEAAHLRAQNSYHRRVFWVPLLQAATMLAGQLPQEAAPPLRDLARSAPPPEPQLTWAVKSMFPHAARRDAMLDALDRYSHPTV